MRSCEIDPAGYSDLKLLIKGMDTNRDGYIRRQEIIDYIDGDAPTLYSGLTGTYNSIFILLFIIVLIVVLYEYLH